MRTYGANVTPSPSMETEVGKKINAEFPGTTGSLGCAISEAVECATTHEGYRYVLGSVLSQVLLHQTLPLSMRVRSACGADASAVQAADLTSAVLSLPLWAKSSVAKQTMN